MDGFAYSPRVMSNTIQRNEGYNHYNHRKKTKRPFIPGQAWRQKDPNDWRVWQKVPMTRSQATEPSFAAVRFHQTFNPITHRRRNQNTLIPGQAWPQSYPNAWRVWQKFPNTRSQATEQFFPAVNPHKTFTPVNLIVTAPNFSGEQPPDLFVFGKSSPKSVKFASAPATGSLPADKDVGAKPVKSVEAENDDDVQYLYTVQTKGGELVEFVDLSEDSEKPKCSDNLKASDHLPKSGIDSSEERGSGNDRIVDIPEKETVQSSKMKNAALRKGRKRRRSCEDILCDVCERDYQTVQPKGQEIFKARCGHMFCQQCLKELDPYKCPECNIYLQKLFKVFL